MRLNLLKILSPLIALALSLQACGGGENESDEGSEITAPVIAGSSFRGLAFTARNVDTSIKSFRVLFYDFEAGLIKTLPSTEQGEGVLFHSGGKTWLFNRGPGDRSFQSLDLSGASAFTATPVNEIGVGDPWDVAAVAGTTRLLLASPASRKLQILDTSSGAVTDIDATGLDTGYLRPQGLLAVSGGFLVAHSGTSASGTTDGSQAVYYAVSEGSGIKFSDLDSDSPEINGVGIVPSNPSGFFQSSGSGALIVGLCLPGASGCQAGASRITGLSGSDLIKLPADFQATLVNRITDGPGQNNVYAHVSNGETYKVVRLELSSGELTDIHEFPDEQLYGLLSDKTTGHLFVGGRSGLNGSLTLYKSEVLSGHVELEVVPYSMVLVPK